jgi:heterodisulfide reductase subunit B
VTRYAFYPGCVMPTEQYAYELSIREVMPLLDIHLVDLPSFSCCGEPLKSVNKFMTLYLAARNIALAEQEQLDLFAPCPMCHLSLSECKYVLNQNSTMRKRINTLLSEESLTYKGTSSLVNTVDLLHDIVGLSALKQRVQSPLTGLTVATHYGCHLIRPKEIGRPVDSENPRKMENILEAIGATPKDYPEKLDCCGALLQTNLPESALTKTGQKLAAVQEQGFDVFIDVCPWCHRMFDAKQQKAGETVATKLHVPVMYLTQLIGLAFGIDKDKLGLPFNLSPVEELTLTKQKEK